MEISAVLDRIGELIAQLKGYAAKLPAVVHLASVPTGVKPKPEAVEAFEQALLRFREQSGRSPFKGLQEYLPTVFDQLLECELVPIQSCNTKISRVNWLFWVDKNQHAFREARLRTSWRSH